MLGGQLLAAALLTHSALDLPEHLLPQGTRPTKFLKDSPFVFCTSPHLVAPAPSKTKKQLQAVLNGNMILFEEAEVLELLKQQDHHHHHHPNIVRYHGCTVNRGNITGLALERYGVMLQYRYEDVPHDLDIAACINGIRAGVKHLHSLGLAHNDLNPTNIGLDGDDNPIILDFGSCKKFGEEPLSGGTYGWIDEDYSTSAPRHDESASDKIEAWLIKEKSERARSAR
ncbi:MAG: hypothetical protein M1837_003233 [Sclerophora amabilis]|nr:MAG: hypothetical protein M1837_003233 [Sclerophora amabilis]